jgi:hypothetical protein
MKRRLLLLFSAIIILAVGCKDAIKNESAPVEVEEGTDTAVGETNQASSAEKTITESDLTGFWVGYFNKAGEEEVNTVNVGEGYGWQRANKINISIDAIDNGKVKGHSVVAGNDRPFEGTVEKTGEGVFSFKVKEPGTDKYDGEFNFTISDKGLEGKWKAFKKIEIQNREYTLEKKTFKYNPDIMLVSGEYIDWTKHKERKEKVEIGDNEFEEFITDTYATTTSSIYDLNASSKLFTKKQVENLKKGDLLIVRNTIYARHGYSFKNRPLRVFFDAQDWYIPVHADIKSDFTDVEKKNIALLLRYEKNASEYYDAFGR